MTVTLSDRLARLIVEKVASGMYAKPEEVVEAALAALDEQEVSEAIAEGYEDSLAGRCRT